ncbi:hypothetical protein [Phenylobacterium sp.]|uniref:hypothetical protein n=1 Tax=Phenylobacterium sp. TaxID=1871053 RepID=UPI0035B41E31
MAQHSFPRDSATRPAAGRARLAIVTAEPRPGVLAPLLKRLRRARPWLAERTVVLDAAAEADLADVRLVLFVLPPALEARDPAAWAGARRIALKADTHWIPVLNRPGGARTTRRLGGGGPDSREGHPPGSLFARLHHRKRAFVLNGEVMNGELLLSASGVFTPSASIFAGRIGKRRLRREARAADQAYFDAAPEATPALAQAARGHGLDFASVEFCMTPQGQARPTRIEPIGELGGTLALAARRRGVKARIERLLDRYAEALEAVFLAELEAGVPGRSAA